ncbi:MAG: hypothetical protein JWN38_982 [Candidatus Saccharibacteria bacterium]|nr:hypothetical protein [Candidatus Saccharibacteria bacterium]
MASSVVNEASSTSSIGAAWPPAPAAFERLRGIFNQGIVETAGDCASFADIFQYYCAELAGPTPPTRLSLRLVTYGRQLRLLESLGVTIEAAIPLANTEPEMVLAYAANNLTGREAGEQSLAVHRRLLQTVGEQRLRDTRDKRKLLIEAGFMPGAVERQQETVDCTQLERQFLEMYAIFGYDIHDVRQILTSPTNTIVYAANQDGIVSTAMAERASIPIAGFGTLELAEITEASTRPDYRQRGLYKAVSGLLIEQLLMRQAIDPVHALYGESNLTMPGVIIASYENGRNFSYFDHARFSVQNPNFGILQQNFSIDDGREQRPYNDFAVSYVPLQSEAVTL